MLRLVASTESQAFTASWARAPIHSTAHRELHTDYLNITLPILMHVLSSELVRWIQRGSKCLFKIQIFESLPLLLVGIQASTTTLFTLSVHYSVTKKRTI